MLWTSNGEVEDLARVEKVVEFVQEFGALVTTGPWVDEDDDGTNVWAGDGFDYERAAEFCATLPPLQRGFETTLPGGCASGVLVRTEKRKWKNREIRNKKEREERRKEERMSEERRTEEGQEKE